MEENQELTDIELSEETIDNLNQGTVEIKTEITGESTDKKKEKKEIWRYFVGALIGSAFTLLVILIAISILSFGVRKMPKGSLLSNRWFIKSIRLRPSLIIFITRMFPKKICWTECTGD